MKTIIIVLLYLMSAVTTTVQGTSAQLVSDILPANGKQTTIVNVRDFGRYAIMAQSAQGAALQYIDRMAGPGEIAGVAGEQDGRLDLFLDRGDYKIITHAHEAGTGDIKLAVRSFTELHGQDFPQLVKLKDLSLSLEDFQQRSFWLHIETRETVILEAAGRNLADLRLWKDGNWLLDITPAAKQVYPLPEMPLQVMQLNATLEPGLYLLSAYGGPSQAWTAQSDEHPFYLRYGIPRLDETGQRRYAVSVFGTDRYQVPGNSNYFHLSVPEASSISMTVDTYRELDAFSNEGRTAAISKKSIPPVAELELGTQNADRLITVSASAGQSYILQHFEKRWRYSFQHSGPYWLSSIHSGAAVDSVDATSILTRLPRFQPELLMDARVVKLDHNVRYERRFNLLDNLTLYLEIVEPGNYVVKGQGEGVAAKFRIEPFLTSRPRDYQAPPFKDSGAPWDLDAGFYVLSARPELKGIVTLSIEKQGDLPSRHQTQLSVAGATRYGVIDLDSDSHYTLYINEQPGVKAGIVLRSAPVNLSTALPVVQRAHEIVNIPIKIPEPGSVRALTTVGTALELSIGDQRWVKQLTLASGNYELSIRNSGNETVNYSLEFAAARLNESSPLPDLPAQALRSMPRFPALAAGQPVYLDLDRHQPATYKLTVDTPALYRVETSGLLDTEGNLRTRTNPSLVRQHANGVGRNFLMQQYLREGDYQLTVKPQHQSRGHLGVSMMRTAIEDGGRLTTEVASRAMLQAGKGLAYGFSIHHKGEYRLRAIGAGRTYLMRLEDADGWPIESPNIAADIIREFDVGEYRMIIRPEAVDSRVVATLEAMEKPTQFHGHGPHRIVFGQTVQHLWREPEQDGQRNPDVWIFEMPAIADIDIALNNDMRGELFSVGSDTQHPIARISPLKTWQGQLPAGQYKLLVKSQRNNNLINYELGITSRQLMVGQQRQISVPATIPIAVGDHGLVELWSYGQSDVRARLYDANGNLVAQGDDRSNDWNFLIALKLPAGFYRLEVEAVGNHTHPTEVSMRTPSTRLEDPRPLPLTTTISDTHAHVFPLLPLSDKKSMLVVQAASNDAVGLSIEVKHRDAEQALSWTELGSATGKSPQLLLPYVFSAAQSYRVRIWSMDRRGASIALLAQAIEPERFGEQQLTNSGIKLKVIPGETVGAPAIGVAAIDLIRPGVFNLDEADDVLWTSRPNEPFSKTYNGLVPASETTLWLAKRLDKSKKTTILSGKRVVLGNQQDKGIQIAIPPYRLAQLDIKENNNPLMVIAQSRVGQAGVALLENGAKPAQGNASQFAVAQQSAVAVAVKPNHPVATVWNAADQSEALEVNLRRMPFIINERKTIAEGRFQAALPASAALELTLPAGFKRISLTFPPETAAVLRRDDKTVSTHWSGNMSLNEVVHSHAEQILILNAGAASQFFALNVDALASVSLDADMMPALSENRLFERRITNRGQLRIPVTLNEANSRRVLRIRGASQGTYIQHNGRVLRGTDLQIDGPGELIVEHRPGMIIAWIDSATPTGSETPAPLLDIAANHTVPLHGKRQAFQINLQKAAQLQLRSDTALITRVVYPNGKEIIEAHPQGVNYSVYLPTDLTTISFLGMGASPMNGVMFVSGIPIEPIQEGFGPESVLGGGGRKMYRFEVQQSGPIGLGVQASSDVVSGVLMDDAGNILSHGVVHMPELAPGQYVFAISVPQESPPVLVRPVIVGLTRPSTGPPWEVIKDYLEQAGRKLDKPPVAAHEP